MPSASSRPARLLPVLGPALAVLAGATMAVQSRVNGQLGARLQDPVAAALVSFLVGLAVMTAVTVLTRAGRRGLRELPAQLRSRRVPRWSVLAGLVGAFFVLAQTSTTGVLGVSVFLLAVVVGQSVGGLGVDRWGIGPGGVQPLTGPRVLGTGLVVAAVLLAVSPRAGAAPGAGTAALALLPVLAGALMPVQTAMNGRIGAAVGTPITPTLVNFLAGTAGLAAATAVGRAVTDPPAWTWPGPWWLYLGGPLGCVFVGAGALLSRRIGVLQTSLGLVTGMLLGGLAIDLALPAPGTSVAPVTVLGTLLTLVGLGVVSLPWRTRGRAAASGPGPRAPR